MKKPYYVIDFSATSCFFEIRVNDITVIILNLKRQMSTKIPINHAISKSGEQQVEVRILPLVGETTLNKDAQVKYDIQLFDVSYDFRFEKQIPGYKSPLIKLEHPIPFAQNIQLFNAIIPYKIKDLWLEGLDIDDVKDSQEKIRLEYNKISKLIKSGSYGEFLKKMENREHNMTCSFYLNPAESKKRLSSLIDDFKGGFSKVILSNESLPIKTAFGKKVSLRKINGESALSFLNEETQEELMLDIEFYYNKNTNQFEII